MKFWISAINSLTIAGSKLLYPHIHADNRGEAVKIALVLFVGIDFLLVCLDLFFQFPLLRFILCGQLQKSVMADFDGGREKSLPLFIDFQTHVSYNSFRHDCRKAGLFMNKRGQETRKHIKKCACSLFAEKGFKQVTMKDICDAAKLSRGGLYCHYESTRQIFQEIIDDMTSEQDNEIDLRIEQNCSAVTILDEILNKYENEMLDSQASLSIAIYEYFSIRDIANQSNTLYEQYLISANTWKKLIQYGMDRHEFNEVDISAVFDLIVFSYQGVRMYSKLMPMDKETPSRIIKEIRRILVKSGSNSDIV